MNKSNNCVDEEGGIEKRRGPIGLRRPGRTQVAPYVAAAKSTYEIQQTKPVYSFFRILGKNIPSKRVIATAEIRPIKASVRIPAALPETIEDRNIRMPKHPPTITAHNHGCVSAA